MTLKRLVVTFLLLFLSIQHCDAFIASTATRLHSISSDVVGYSENVYWNQYTEMQKLDQAVFGSIKFWSDIDRNVPNWRTAPSYERFRGFCTNLQNEPPGREVFMPNGQQLLTQYVFPGIDKHRAAYPTEYYPELQRLRSRLQNDVQPIAQQEFRQLLTNRPLVNDDDVATTGALDESIDGDTWQRAAWYGWQYLSVRGAKRFMPQTTTQLQRTLNDIGGPAHRFVGVTRQRHNCTGVLHSDGRNYMLSTLTPVNCPVGCGIVVDHQNVPIYTDPIILDNTYPHYVYNNHETEDRFCLMSEVYHPDLTVKERDAISTLFAVKDRYTVVELQLAPWGYADEDLAEAIKHGAIHDLKYWKQIDYTFDPDTLNHKKRVKRTSSSSSSGNKKGFGVK